MVGIMLEIEPLHEKTKNSCFRPGPTQTDGYGHRTRLEARNFRFKKKRNYTICVAKTKTLISCAVTAQLNLHLCFRICRSLVFLCGGSVIAVVKSRLPTSWKTCLEKLSDC